MRLCTSLRCGPPRATPRVLTLNGSPRASPDAACGQRSSWQAPFRLAGAMAARHVGHSSTNPGGKTSCAAHVPSRLSTSPFSSGLDGV